MSGIRWRRHRAGQKRHSGRLLRVSRGDQLLSQQTGFISSPLGLVDEQIALDQVQGRIDCFEARFPLCELGMPL